MLKGKLFIISVILSVGTVFGQADTVLIKNHLTAITKTKGYRHFMNVDLLNKVANYIHSNFEQYADTTYFQEFELNGLTYKNVICVFEPTKLNSIGEKNTQTIVIGAHYDVCGMQEGADDNASGVVGLLELARLLKGQLFNYRIELVAYTLEEPPYFRTENMGSHVHAESLVDSNTDVYGMLSLEMIGYFVEEKKSQDYPLGFLKLFYGTRGNYITLVNKFGKGKFSRKFTSKFKHSDVIRTKRFNGPKALPGVDFSDHLNYWKYGFSALMITDTAFYRNKNYHEQGDVMEILDLPKMAKVIDGVIKVLLDI
jgi:Zn-dependent M28 family amino/carboxypeptidase